MFCLAFCFYPKLHKRRENKPRHRWAPMSSLRHHHPQRGRTIRHISGFRISSASSIRLACLHLKRHNRGRRQIGHSCFVRDEVPMERKTISSRDAPQAVGPYSHATRAGDFIFCSGQAGFDPKTGRIVKVEFALKRLKLFEI